jgi:carboxymethylenebutenolidase
MEHAMDRAELTARAIELYDRFTHISRDRRAFFADMTKLAGSAAAANALIATIAADPLAAAVIAEDDKRVWTKTVTWTGAGGHRMSGYLALPANHKGDMPFILIVHENRGLQPYTRDVARRLAVAGFGGLAADFLSPGGGTPGNEDEAREKIAALDLSATVADGVATLKWLKQQPRASGSVGIVGFCWGGALVNRIAIAAGGVLNAAVAFYGPTPDPAEAAKVNAPMLLHYAGSDDRVNTGAAGWVDALKKAHVPVTRYDYPGTQHAFHNDTAGVRYNPEAARLAWDRTIAFFKERLA